MQSIPANYYLHSLKISKKHELKPCSCCIQFKNRKECEGWCRVAMWCSELILELDYPQVFKKFNLDAFIISYFNFEHEETSYPIIDDAVNRLELVN